MVGRWYRYTLYNVHILTPSKLPLVHYLVICEILAMQTMYILCISIFHTLQYIVHNLVLCQVFWCKMCNVHIHFPACTLVYYLVLCEAPGSPVLEYKHCFLPDGWNTFIPMWPFPMRVIHFKLVIHFSYE